MRTWKSTTAIGAAMLALAGAANAGKDTVEVRDGAIGAGETARWTADHIYRMHGKVYVRSGSVLDIEPGTLVLADARQDSATVLVVARGGRILARGTADAPVVFTSELDSLAPSGALPNTNLSRGLWGGIAILGRAPNNQPGGVGNLSKYISGDSSLVRYGDSSSTDVHDSSGVLAYVSVRHTGIADVGTVKGVTFGSVGDRTVVDHLELYATGDDGLDLLGGTVNVKHLVSSFSAGDAFFYSYGYRGRIQFLFTIQNIVPGGASNGVNVKIETADTLLKPVSIAQIWNATHISAGKDSGSKFTGKYKYALVYKKDGAGTFANSIVAQTPFGGIFVDTSKLKDAAKSRTSDSLGTSLVVKNNIWTAIGAGDSLAGVAMGVPLLSAYLRQNQNDTVDPVLGGISWSAERKLDPRPSASGIAYRNVATVPAGGFFEQTDFRGAFGQANWAAGWTALSRGGYFSDAANAASVVHRTGATSFARISGRDLVVGTATAGTVRLDVFDLSGRQLASRSVQATAGTTRVRIPSEARGLAVVRARAGDRSTSLLTTLP